MGGVHDERRGHSVPGMPRWARELLGVAAASAIAIATVAAVAASARSELLFRDADSLVTTLVVHSLAAGQPQDWAMSSVLFLPEIAVLWLLSLLGLGVNGTLALAGVVNLVALYAALRVAAGSVARGRAPIAGGLLALGGVALLAATEASPSRDALELASLVTLTTYYSATVVGTVLVVGLARRGLDAASPVPPWATVVLIGVVAAASVITNPLFAAWATVPLALVLGVLAIRIPAARRLAAALVAGSLAGFAARIPLAPFIANTGAGYADPSQWLRSLEHYGALLADRWDAPWGAASVIVVVALWGGCLGASVSLTRRRDPGAAMVAACGWVMPLVVIVGAIALGTHAARYLQPAVFAPLLVLVVLPSLVRRPSPRVRPVAVIGAATVALVVAAGIGVPRIAASASAPDRDLACVVDWVEASDRTGAGQFWTVRLPKTHLADPRDLVQVDHRLRGYAWLVNRDDFAVGAVSFLVIDGQSPAFDIPGGVEVDVSAPEASAGPRPVAIVDCGRYTIADFGETLLPLGPQRS